MELFPVGTIIKLKGMNHPVMITGYYQKYEDKIYEYIGVLYPSGFMSKGSVIAFQSLMIDSLVSEGYKDEDCEKLLKALPRIASGLVAVSKEV